MKRLANAMLLLVAFGVVQCSSNDGGRPVAQKSQLVLATTTSTVDTGLLDFLVPKFERETGAVVKVVAVGTGQALELGRRGEADVLLVHAPSKEKQFVADGFGKNRKPVMHNDFVIVGPKNDPAGIKGAANLVMALVSIVSSGSPWVSRGDKSGTHTKEQELWKLAASSQPKDLLLETGQGMGASLRVASERRAYTLSDRGTFIATQNLELIVLHEGSEILHNPYHVIEVVGTKADGQMAKQLAGFFLKRETQEAIGRFEVLGHKLFKPESLRGK